LIGCILVVSRNEEDLGVGHVSCKNITAEPLTTRRANNIVTFILGGKRQVCQGLGFSGACLTFATENKLSFMRKNNLYWIMLAVLMLSMAGCQMEEKRSMTIEIQNNTNTVIAKAQVWAIGSSASTLLIEQIGLAADSTHRQAVKSDLSLTSDGTYELRLIETAGNRTFRLGYFTNGTSLDQMIYFQIEKDTILGTNVMRVMSGY
jgi:hypothetical protein